MLNVLSLPFFGIGPGVGDGDGGGDCWVGDAEQVSQVQ